jgi:hypothetical protein
MRGVLIFANPAPETWVVSGTKYLWRVLKDRHYRRRRAVHEIIYLIGLIVVISFLLGLLGFR